MNYSFQSAPIFFLNCSSFVTFSLFPFRHYVMAPSLYNAYGSTTFPAIVDYLYDIKKTLKWEEVKKQLTITTYLVEAAARNLASAN